MALEVRTLRDASPPAVLIADRTLYLTKDQAEIVEEGERAEFLLARQGNEIPPAQVKRLGLGLVEGRVVVLAAVPDSGSDPGRAIDAEAKARAAPANKARRKGEDK